MVVWWCKQQCPFGKHRVGPVTGIPVYHLSSWNRLRTRAKFKPLYLAQPTNGNLGHLWSTLGRIVWNWEQLCFQTRGGCTHQELLTTHNQQFLSFWFEISAICCSDLNKKNRRETAWPPSVFGPQILLAYTFPSGSLNWQWTSWRSINCKCMSMNKWRSKKNGTFHRFSNRSSWKRFPFHPPLAVLGMVPPLSNARHRNPQVYFYSDPCVCRFNQFNQPCTGEHVNLFIGEKKWQLSFFCCLTT